MAGPTGVDTAKGLLEKLPGAIPFPVLVRVLAPGALAISLLFPYAGTKAPKLEVAQSDSVVVYLPMLIYVFGLLAAALVLGAIVSIALGGEIYKIYEGRILWPRWLLRVGVAIEARRISRLRQKAAAALARGDMAAYNEYWFRLRSYPLDATGDPYAERPTRLGNILSEYESYPDSRYGMDAVFYWPRLWMAVDKDKKAEIDSEWALADGLLTLAAVSAAGGLLWLATAAVHSIFPVRLPTGSPSHTIVGGLGLVALSVVWYRLSLPFHRQNGEVFKAIFDLYRDRLHPMMKIGAQESATWDRLWLYLQYRMIRCLRCDTPYAAHIDPCPTCGLPRAQSFKPIQRSTPPGTP